MEHSGLDPETALKLIQILLRGAAYFFAGFALLALSTYVVFVCLEISASQPSARTRIAKVPPPVGCAPAAEQIHVLLPANTPILAEEATVTVGEVLWEARIQGDFPGTDISAHHRRLGIDTSHV
jgi:hypothetical protein